MTSRPFFRLLALIMHTERQGLPCGLQGEYWLDAYRYCAMLDSQEVLIAIRRILRASEQHSSLLHRRTGLTTAQFHVLRLLAEQPGCTLGQLARAARISQATLTVLVDRLEQRELVRRERDPTDKRKVLLQLTAAGGQTLETAPSLLQENFLIRFRSLPEWEQHLILAGLGRVAELMDAGELDCAPILAGQELT